MAVGRIEGYQPRYNVSQPKEQVKNADSEEYEEVTVSRDRLELSPEAELHETVSPDEEKNPDSSEDEAESEKVSGSVGINAAKLARILAAAKTRSQVQAVMEMIMSDLRECDAGKEQGLEVDEESVKAAESLLEEARSRMNSAEDREPTPQEEMASALAALM